MDTVKQKPKETDITGVLVLVLVLLIGALIAKLSMDFTSQKTSSSTKAAPRATASDYIPFCKGKVESNLGRKYNVQTVLSQVSAKLYTKDCGNGYTRFAVGILEAGSGTKKTVEPGVCCVATQPLFVVNDNWCTAFTPRGHWPDGKTVEHIPAVCKNNNACTGDYGTVNTKDYTVLWPETKCDNVTGTKVEANKNFCCMMPLEQD